MEVGGEVLSFREIEVWNLCITFRYELLPVRVYFLGTIPVLLYSRDFGSMSIVFNYSKKTFRQTVT